MRSTRRSVDTSTFNADDRKLQQQQQGTTPSRARHIAGAEMTLSSPAARAEHHSSPRPRSRRDSKSFSCTTPPPPLGIGREYGGGRDDPGGRRRTSTYDPDDLSENTLDIRNSMIGTWINDLEKQNKAMLATLANVERGVLEVSDTDQSVSVPVTTSFANNKMTRGRSQSQQTTTTAATSSSASVPEESAVAGKEKRRSSSSSAGAMATATATMTVNDSGRTSYASVGSQSSGKGIVRSLGGGSSHSNVDEKDARIAELEGHVKSLVEQLQHLTEKESKHAKECGCPVSVARSSAATTTPGHHPVRDSMTQTEPAQASPSRRVDGCGRGSDGAQIPEDVARALSEILGSFNACCTCGADASGNPLSARHDASCFSVNKNLERVCHDKEELLGVLNNVKAKLASSCHSKYSTPTFSGACSVDLTFQQGQEISEMEDLIRQLKTDFSRIRSKCEDLLQQDPSQLLNDSGFDRSNLSCGSNSSRQLNSSRKVKESCQALEAKIDKLSSFLADLSDRLWLSPAGSSMHLNAIPETSDDEWRGGGGGRGLRGKRRSFAGNCASDSSTGCGNRVERTVNHLKTQLKEKANELSAAHCILEEKEHTIQNLTQELGELRALKTSTPNASRCSACCEESDQHWNADECTCPCTCPPAADHQVDWMKKEIRELRRQLCDMKEEKRLLELNLTSLRANHEALSQEVEGSKDEEQSLTAHIQELETSNAAMETKIEGLAKAKRALEEKFRKKLRESQESHSLELAKYKEKCAAQKSELADVTHCLEKLQDDINHWQCEAERYKDNSKDLGQRYDDLEQELGRAREDSGRLKEENQELEARLHSFHDDLNTMKQELCSYKSNMSELADENKDLRSRIKQMTENSKNAGALEDEICRMSGELDEKSLKISHLEQELHLLRDHNSRLEFELNSSNQRLKQSRLKHEDAERRCENLQESVDQAAKTENQLKQSLDEGQRREQQLTSQLKELEEGREEASRLVERLQKENQKLKKVTEKSQQNVSDQLESLKTKIADQMDKFGQREQHYAAEMRDLKEELDSLDADRCRLVEENADLTRQLREATARCEELGSTAVLAQKFRSDLTIVQGQVEEVCRQKSEVEARSHKTSKKLRSLQDEMESLKEEREKLTGKIQNLETSLELAQRAAPESKKAIKEREKILTSLRESVTELDNRCRGLVEEVDRSRRQRRLLLKECETRTQELAEARALVADLKAKQRESKREANRAVADLTSQLCAYKKRIDRLTAKLKDHEALFRKMRAKAFGDGGGSRSKILGRSVSEEFVSGVESVDLVKDLSFSNESLLSP